MIGSAHIYSSVRKHITVRHKQTPVCILILQLGRIHSPPLPLSSHSLAFLVAGLPVQADDRPRSYLQCVKITKIKHPNCKCPQPDCFAFMTFLISFLRSKILHFLKVFEL